MFKIISSQPIIRLIWRILFSRIGEWRTDFLWRFFGLVICQLGILLLYETDTIEKLLQFPIGFHLAIGCGLLLILLGARLLLLLLTSVAMLIFLIPWTREVVERQVADEYLLLMVLPIAGVCLTLLSVLQSRFQRPDNSCVNFNLNREVDTSHVALFRLTILIAMFFATFHKLNHDFFNPTVSCGGTLAKELSFWWRFPFPASVLNAKPYQIILGEGLIPVLLLLYPRVGILFTTLFLGLIGHIGPTVFTMTMIMMACSFLQAEDGSIILRGLKRYWSGLLTFTLLISVISFKMFTGKRTWFEFHIYQIVIIALTFCVLYRLASDWKALKTSLSPVMALRQLLIPRFNMAALLPLNKAIKIALVSYALLFFLNGMSPYFGLKYRYSFAMLSNLRVDDARWNSMLIPKWFYLRQYDPFIHVTRVETDRYTRRRLAKLELKRQREMQPGLISPMSFKHRLEILKRLNAKVDVEFTYRGHSYFFQDAASNRELERWLKGIPDSKMFQEWLTLEGPQPCVH